jgi:hypothetical protein
MPNFLKRKRRTKAAGGIALDIERIERKIRKEEDRMAEMSDLFFRDGGVCCPFCGMPGYSELALAQERREKWLVILKRKATNHLVRSGQAA